MAVKSRSKTSRRAPFLRLAYSAPVSQEAGSEDIRRFVLSATKALPFVRLRAHDQPLWCPESYWRVEPTGKRDADVQLGRKYARAAIAAMKADGNRHLIAHIFQDITKDVVERTGKRGCARFSPIARGFLVEISEALAAAR